MIVLNMVRTQIPILIMDGELFLIAENTETLAFESQTPDDLLTRLDYPADDPAGKWNLADLFIVEFPEPSAMQNLRSSYY